jgi:putative SOS response-associated peptidase YedK
MCNLYRLDKGQDALRRFFKVDRDDSGNQPPLPETYPDQLAPIVRDAEGQRIMEMRRWGMPTPPKFLAAGSIDRGVTNIRNTSSAHWRAWLKPEHRCLVPVTAFSEPTDKPNPQTRKKDWYWFALDDTQPLFAFAGLWCDWHGIRGTKKEPIEGRHRLHAFLTTEPNGVVQPIHSKAMPAILTTPEEFDAWLSAPIEEALRLQRPLPDHTLKIVGMGREADNPQTSQLSLM